MVNYNAFDESHDILLSSILDKIGQRVSEIPHSLVSVHALFAISEESIFIISNISQTINIRYNPLVIPSLKILYLLS